MTDLGFVTGCCIIALAILSVVCKMSEIIKSIKNEFNEMQKDNEDESEG